jgi:hypothetical protein
MATNSTIVSTRVVSAQTPGSACYFLFSKTSIWETTYFNPEDILILCSRRVDLYRVRAGLRRSPPVGDFPVQAIALHIYLNSSRPITRLLSISEVVNLPLGLPLE